jgi:RNA polymerase sigma-70 factor (family 1)
MFSDNEKKYEEFKIVFEEYYNPLCNYAYSILKDATMSEDVVQEVFVRIWEKKQDLVGSPSLQFYLFRAVHNNCLSQIKQNKKKQFIHSENMEKEFAKLHDENQEEETSYLPLIRKALSLLPPKCKEVFLLSRISNLSYKEIAGMLGISAKTVENQIGKALKIFKNFIRENKSLIILCTLACISLIKYNYVGDYAKMLFF